MTALGWRRRWSNPSQGAVPPAGISRRRCGEYSCARNIPSCPFCPWRCRPPLTELLSCPCVGCSCRPPCCGVYGSPLGSAPRHRSRSSRSNLCRVPPTWYLRGRKCCSHPPHTDHVVNVGGVLDLLQREVGVAVGNYLDILALGGETLEHVFPRVVGDGLSRIFYFCTADYSLQEVLLAILTCPYLDVHQLIQHREAYLVQRDKPSLLALPRQPRGRRSLHFYAYAQVERLPP